MMTSADIIVFMLQNVKREEQLNSAVFLLELIPDVSLHQIEHRFFLIKEHDLLLHITPKALSKTPPCWRIWSPELWNAKTADLIALVNLCD